MLPGLSGPAGLTRELWLLVKFLEARCIGGARGVRRRAGVVWSRPKK